MSKFNFRPRTRICFNDFCSELAGSNSKYCRACNDAMANSSTNRGIYTIFKHSKALQRSRKRG